MINQEIDLKRLAYQIVAKAAAEEITARIQVEPKPRPKAAE
jgi:hypothetical protein